MLTLLNLKKFFSGKKVLITGHTGFKGSWLTFILKEVGAKVMGVALPPATDLNHFDLLKIEKDIHHVIADIRDTENIVDIINKFQPEIVFHLAAQALVRPSYNDPLTTYSTNIIGSVNVMEAVRQSKSIRSLIYITSDKCYENVEQVWGYRENDQLGGRDPYSSSKAACEIIFSSYNSSFFEHNKLLGAATTRAGNVIGGGDWALDRIIPDCIRAIENNTPIQLRNPKATRPWQHVLEPLAGYLLLSKKLYNNPKTYSGSWNFGPPSHEIRTVEEVSKIIIDHFGKGSIEKIEVKKQLHEAHLLQLNCDKAHHLLGWYPRWKINKSLKATAIWYKKVMNGQDADIVTRDQIHSYFKETT